MAPKAKVDHQKAVEAKRAKEVADARALIENHKKRKSHRRLGEAEKSELKAARRLVREDDARKACDHRIEAPGGVPPARQDPPVRKRRHVQSHEEFVVGGGGVSSRTYVDSHGPLRNEAGLQQELREDFHQELREDFLGEGGEEVQKCKM